MLLIAMVKRFALIGYLILKALSPMLAENFSSEDGHV